MEVSGQLNDPAALPLGEQAPVSVFTRMGGPHSRSGSGGEEKKYLPLPGREPQSSSP